MRDFVGARLESPAFEPGTVHVAELTGTEQISRLFEFQLRLATLDGIDEEALLTQPATLVFERRAEDGTAAAELRRITGMVRAIRDRALSESKHREYIATFVPRAWRATLTKTSDVCMDLNVPDIIKKKLGEVGMDEANDVLFRVRQQHATREFVVQYHESHWDFVCRLAEDLGIHFSIEEIDGRDVLVFGDDNTAFTPSHPASSPFRQRGDQVDVYELEARRELVSKNFVARDYNYRNPSMEVLGQAQNAVLGEGKVDEFGPHAKTPAEATYYARVRAEEAASRSLTFEGRSDLPGLRAGSLLTIDGHPRGDIDLIVTEVVHELAQPVFGVVTGNERPYRNTFRGLPKKVPFRPARLTPKPVVHGVVTGIVESEASTKMGAIDDQGRYRVAFMYDSVTERGEGKASRPLRMAQPSAGVSRGFHAPLKPGTEVIITCVNGDPDRPIIAGAVPNPQTPTPVTAANAEKSMWTTNVNSIAIDDDQPRCKVSVSGEDHVFQVGEPNAPEQGIVSATIGNVSSVANGTMTSVSGALTAWSEWKAAASAEDIVNIAGVPHPFSLWKKIETVAEVMVGFAKGAVDSCKAVQQICIDNAKEHQKEADEKYDAAKKEANLNLDVTPRPLPGMKMETQQEAEARAIKEAAATAAANGDTATLAKLATLEAARLEAAEKAADTKAWEEGGEAAWKTPEEIVKSAEAIVGAAKTAAKLISQLSKIFGKVTEDANFGAMKFANGAAAKDALKSGQRHAADLGRFDKSFNIQGATDSIGIWGGQNALVNGGRWATLYSPIRTNVVGGSAVHVKSPKLVEIAGEDIVATAKKMVDVHASEKVKIVAHSGDKSIAVPAGHTMYLHSKEGIAMDSVEKDIEITAKQSFKVKTHDKDIDLTAEKGKIEIMAKDGQSSMRAKKKALVQSLEDDFTVVADKGKGTVKAKKELNLDSKSGQWKTSGNIEFKVKNFTVNGSKVELG